MIKKSPVFAALALSLLFSGGSDVIDINIKYSENEPVYVADRGDDHGAEPLASESTDSALYKIVGADSVCDDDVDGTTQDAPTEPPQDNAEPDADGVPSPLTFKEFKRLLSEAKKYLGYRYVWGGSSPQTSFDCSGYVSWVVNHSGIGVNVGRMSSKNLYKLCTKVSKSELMPGDLVFFKGTYATSGVSHVGIYVGDGKMIHCGSRVEYASLSESYWRSHFYAYGRLPNE